MLNHSHRISHNGRLLLAAVVVLGFLAGPGCHDWPDERSTAIEAQNILRDLSRIDTVDDPNIPIPAAYKLPPQKFQQLVGGAEEWKLVYCCKYHTADKMRIIIEEQFSSTIFDAKGKSKTVPNFGVSAHPDTNQLIVRCLTEEDVDAVQEIIEAADIPPIQVKIECMVSEVYADLTVDRETRVLIENLFGEGIVLGGNRDNEFLAFPGAALRDPARETFGLKIGIASGDEGHRFNALVDILVSRGYLKILMNPTLEVVNGQMAKIQSKQHMPLQEVFLRGGYGDTSYIETRTEYYDIIDSLEITPHVYADGAIGLQTTAQLASHLTPEGIKQLPIVTERIITNKENRVRHGESLIIGGIRKTEKRDVVRGVPILKDIPGLNLLFSGRDFEERATEILFIITPTVSTGGKPNEDMVERLKARHASPMTQGLHEAVMDPLGLRAREQESERQVEEARSAQQQSEAEMTAARLEALTTGQQVEDLSAELEEARAEADQATTTAEEAASRAEAAEAEAQKATAEAKRAKDEAAKAKTEAEKAKAKLEDVDRKAAEPRSDDKPPQQEAEPNEEAPQAKEEN